MSGNLPLAKLLNQTAMRTVPMGLYGNYGAGWQSEVACASLPPPHIDTETHR